MQRVIHSRSMPGSPAPKQKNSQETLRPAPCPPTRPARQVPRRMTSLKTVSLLSPITAQQGGLDGTAPEHGPAAEVRHAQRAASSRTGTRQSSLATPTMTPTSIVAPATSPGRKNSYRLSRAKKAAFVSQVSSSPSGPSSSSTPSSSSPAKNRSRRSASPTTPVVADVKMIGGPRQEKAGRPEKRTAPPVGGARGRSSNGVGSDNAKAKKENRKDRGWSWVSWWQ
ncbi:uncharacterized protein B0T15DRAFT_162475 [Chaetomium strumarium]|uniref:Uncharacterized protein n=1 Tax=Chaetomium strumarium TaxID=1170767 RepID=A0AAJ0M2Z5_9PEZI|nr:hypothetical protein B0T15DRAFT_162475 [Chaetomium strumarium]